MKKNLIISLCLLTLFTAGCGCNKKNKEKEEKLDFDVNFNITDDQEVNGLKMTNTSLIIEDGVSSFSTIVTNVSGNDYKLKSINIVFKNKDGNTITTLSGYVGSTIKKDESKTLVSSTDKDLTNATKIEYKINN